MRWFLALVLVFCVLPAHAQQGVNPGDIRVELVLEARDHVPLQGEMVLLSIQGTYRIPVIREKLHQPDLDGFDWMQLGEDRWYKEREDGFEVLKLERRMALFPQRAGPLEIPEFTHGLEMLGRNGRTVPVEHLSNTLSLEVAPRPDTNDWWFPVRGIEIEDNWSNQPEALEPGGAALRVIALTVDGTAPQRIPPMPEMTGAGAFIFPHPEHRIVALGPDGPRTRVFWRWTVRPQEGSAGYTNPIQLAWFDTEAQEAREISLSAQRIAYSDGPQEVLTQPGPVGTVATRESGSDWGSLVLPGLVLPLGGALGLCIGLALALQSHSPAWRLPAWLRKDPLRRDLQRAARSGNSMGVRNIAHAMADRDGREVPRDLFLLDRKLFGDGKEQPDLKDVVRSVLQRRRRMRPRDGL